jgi:hypothetical protein
LGQNENDLMRVSNWVIKILEPLLRSAAVGGLCTLAIVVGTFVARSPAGATSPSAKSCEVPASTKRIPPQFSGPAFTPDQWEETTILSGVTPQAIDTESDTAYQLTSNFRVNDGYGHLQRFDLVTQQMKSGPTFDVNALTLAAGYLWIYGSQTLLGRPLGAVLCEVSPSTLRLIRQVRIPNSGRRRGLPSSLTQGPGRSIWASFGRILVQVDAQTGAILRRVTIPSGDIQSISSDPSGRYLYASVSYPKVNGKMVDQQVDEFSAQTGHALLATGAKSPITEAVAGGSLVALPDGVADSFRTGMAGATEFLRQNDLSLMTPLGVDPRNDGFTKPPNDVFEWMMDASTLYADNTLWIANENGVLACVDPTTGALRESEQGTPAWPGQLVAIDLPGRRVLLAINNLLVAVTPPAPCWG